MDISKFGTKAALQYALNMLCRNAKVEEWTEYGGDPYYFRITLEASSVGASLRTLMRVINSIRPVRSLLESGAIILHSEEVATVSEQSGFVIYSIRCCGVIPEEAVKGRIEDEIITITLGADGAEFVAVLAGTKDTGTIPSEAVSGIARSGNINLGTMGDAAAYHARACGTSPGSLI